MYQDIRSLSLMFEFNVSIPPRRLRIFSIPSMCISHAFRSNEICLVGIIRI